MFSGNRNEFFQRNENVLQISLAVNYNNNIQKSVENNFLPLDIYLWIHGVGFVHGFQCRKRYILSTLMSLILILITETFHLYSIFRTFNKITIFRFNINKKTIIFATVLILEFALRILLYVKRKSLKKLIRQIGEIYSMVTHRNMLNFKFKLSVILLVCDVSTIVTLLFMCSQFSSSLFGDISDSYYFGVIPPPHSSKIFYISLFIIDWNTLSLILPIYFCWYCYVLKLTLNELKKNVSHKQNVQVDDLENMYDKVVDLICLVNKKFHSMLIIAYTILLLWMFYESYILTFTEVKSAIEMVFHLMYMISCVLRFTLSCLFASSVTKAAQGLKEMIYKLQFEANDCNNFPFLLKIHEQFVGFTLFDTFIIGKNLIVSSVASLVTYGIMIATFNVNAHEA